jgi:hypothetical protein
MEKRCSFELFKSNVCHWLKEEGDIDFLIQVLESDLIRKYYDSSRSSPRSQSFSTALCGFLCHFSRN